MKRKSVMYLILSVAFIFLYTTISFSATKTLTINFTSPFPMSDPRTQTYKYWGDMVEKGTSGRVKVALFPGGSLVTVTDTYSAMSKGSIGGGLLISSYLDPIIPEFVITSLAGTIPILQPEDLIKVDKAIHQIMKKILEKHNLLYLFPTFETTVCVIVRKGKNPVTKLEDFKGLKLRDAGKYTSIFLRNLGASTISLDISQLTAALSYGTLDGAVFNWLSAQAIRAADVAPSLTLLDHYGTWVFSGMNLDMFKSLSKEDQNVLLQAADKAAEYSVKLGRKATDDFFANPGGFKIYRLSKEDHQKLMKEIGIVKAEILKTAPPEGKELAEALEKIK